MGFKKARKGHIERVYFDPGYYDSVKYNEPVKSIISGAGFNFDGQSTQQQAGRKINSYFNKKFLGQNISRRRFLKTATLASFSTGILACQKEEKLGEEIINLPIPEITGPAELIIPKVGMGAIGTFDSAGTKGATNLYWQLIKPLSLMDSVEQKGSETSINISFPIPGVNEVRLLADNSAGRARQSHFVNVNPPVLPDKNYDLPLLFYVDESPINSGQPKFALYSLDIKTLQFSKLFSGEKLYSYGSWKPSGECIVFVSWVGPDEAEWQENPYSITTYNLITGSFKDISIGHTGRVWWPSWSPKGDWIAYLDDTNSINHLIDDVVLVKPDGSGQFYLRGNSQSPYFSGESLSWDPEGKRLVAGGSSISLLKLSLFDNLFSGSPTIQVIPTDDQKERYYDAEAETFMKRGLTKEIFMRYFFAGANGVAWSPNGDVVAYSANFGLSPDNPYMAILLSRIDGTGDIQTLARSSEDWGADVDFWLPTKPTWSPDGLYIYFTAKKYMIDCLYKYDLTTKSYHELLIPIQKISCPCLYG